MTGPPLTPATMRDLAAAARDLSARVTAAGTRLRADPEGTGPGPGTGSMTSATT